jgi:hypothetical protein
MADPLAGRTNRFFRCFQRFHCIPETILQKLNHEGVAGQIRGWSLRNPRRLGRIQPAEQRARFTIFSRNDDVQQYAARCRQNRRAHIPDRDPCAVREFEVLGNSACKTQPQLRLLRIQKRDGIADAIEPFLIEGLFRQIRPFEITWRNIGSLDPCLVSIGNRDQF